jgi:hypothetical protein
VIPIFPKKRPHIFNQGVAAFYESTFSIGRKFSEKTPDLAGAYVGKMIAQKNQVKSFCTEQPQSFASAPGSGRVVSFHQSTKSLSASATHGRYR